MCLPDRHADMVSTCYRLGMLAQADREYDKANCQCQAAGASAEGTRRQREGRLAAG